MGKMLILYFLSLGVDYIFLKIISSKPNFDNPKEKLSGTYIQDIYGIFKLNQYNKICVFFLSEM